jgi:excisionase family DNA binding protein
LATLAEAAKLLRVHRATLYPMLRVARIPGAFRVGERWRFDLEEFERFLEAKGRGE